MVTNGQRAYLAVCEVMTRRGGACNVDIGFGNVQPSPRPAAATVTVSDEPNVGAASDAVSECCKAGAAEASAIDAAGRLA
jgi:hypothetical protein